jgi:hypothetical protein
LSVRPSNRILSSACHAIYNNVSVQGAYRLVTIHILLQENE